MPRISIDAIHLSTATALAPFSNEDRIDGIAAILQEAAELKRASAVRWRRTRRWGLGRPSLNSVKRSPGECSRMVLLTMAAFIRTGDPMWFVLAAGLGSQSLMSASFEFSAEAAGPASRRPSALTKSRVS
jgi:hypothetical protein